MDSFNIFYKEILILSSFLFHARFPLVLVIWSCHFLVITFVCMAWWGLFELKIFFSRIFKKFLYLSFSSINLNLFGLCWMVLLCIYRNFAELGCTISFLPLHGVVPAARLTSHLSINARAFSELSHGTFRRSCQDR